MDTVTALIDMCNEYGVIYVGSTEDPEERADQHERNGFSGTMYYAETQNMKQAENKLFDAKKGSYRYSDHQASNQEEEPGYVYLIKGKKYL